MNHRHPARAVIGTLLALALAVLASACNTLQPARMALPDGLAARSEVIELPRLSGGARGRTQVAGQALTFERTATRLSLFDEGLLHQRSALRYALDGDATTRGEANCSQRRRSLSFGVIEWTAKPLALFCDFAPSGVRLDLEEHRPAIGTQKIARRGLLRVGDRRLSVRSVHQAEGALFETAQPLGYVIDDLGQPIAAVDIAGRAPRLLLSTTDPALRQASLQTLLALALIWDPTEG